MRCCTMLPLLRAARLAVSLLIPLLLAAPPGAQAQSTAKTAAIGQSFTPSNRIVLFSKPENGLIVNQKATALVAPSAGAVSVFPLTQEGSDYVTGQPQQANQLTIEGVRDVVQGRSVSTWLKVTGAGKSGWIKYDPAVTGSLSQYGITTSGGN